MAKYDYHDVDTVTKRILTHKKTAESEVRQARTNVIDGFDHAASVIDATVTTVLSLVPGFEASGKTAMKLANEKAREYCRKAQHIRESMQRIVTKKEEVKHQRSMVEQERQQDIEHYTAQVQFWHRDSEQALKQVMDLLARIETNENCIRKATRADQESAWKEQVLVGVLDENDRVLDSCNDEIGDAPELLDRCGKVASDMAEAAKRLTSELCINLNKDVVRRRSDGRDMDVSHYEEYNIARKKVFRAKLQVGFCY